MERPRVTIHSLVSADGRLDGFPAAVGTYYDVAARLPHQAVLSGSGTMAAAAAEAGIDLTIDDPPASRDREPPDDRPWLAVVDSGGRLRRVEWLRSTGLWRDVLMLCSASTPDAQLERLRRSAVEYVVVGSSRVDLAAGLGILADRYGVRDVRVDAGPSLGGALLRAGLVDAISLILAPWLAGPPRTSALRLFDEVGQAQRLRLESSQPLDDGHLWVQFTVKRPGGRV